MKQHISVRLTIIRMQMYIKTINYEGGKHMNELIEAGNALLAGCEENSSQNGQAFRKSETSGKNPKKKKAMNRRLSTLSFRFSISRRLR